MTDRGLAALAGATRSAFGCAYPRSPGTHEACSVTDERVAAILGERGVFLPDGPDLMIEAMSETVRHATEVVMPKLWAAEREIARLRKIEEAARAYLWADGGSGVSAEDIPDALEDER